MFRIIFNNLRNRRKQNGWLFAELIIVSILTWVIIDPTVIILHDITSDPGYDADRIINIRINNYEPGSKYFDVSGYDAETAMNNFNIIRSKVSHMPDVKKFAVSRDVINAGSYMSGHFNSGNPAIDTIAGSSMTMDYLQGEPFLSTYGLEAAEGSPSIEQLETASLNWNDIIITESLDRTYWPDRRGIKDKQFYMFTSQGDTLVENVVGIIKDFKPFSYSQLSAVKLWPNEIEDHESFNTINLIVRLKDGIDPETYIKDNDKTIRNELQVGNFYVKSIVSQKGLIREYENKKGITSQRNLNLFIAALFLINLIVGVTGCVWLQTGKRVAELGILRSYGARRSQIIKMLMGESIVLATAAAVIGCIIYLQYALKEGLTVGYEGNVGIIAPESWVNNFGAHFAIISAIVYAIIIICVIIGTYFPARHVSRIEPVDALRDE